MKSKLVCLVLVVSIFCIYASANSLAADSETNISARDIAAKCLTDSRQIMRDLISDGFSVQKINDTIKTMGQIYDVQVAVEIKRLTSDYSVVISYCNEILGIKESAYKARDALFSLEADYQDFLITVKSYKVNVSDIDLAMVDIRQEIKDERYSQVIEKAPIIEQKIANAEAQASTSQLLYSTLSGGIKSFFVNNYILISIIVIAVLIFLIFYRLRLKRYLILREITKLEIEKQVLKEIIKKTQRDYFQEGKIPEGVYNIKTKRYAEMIRDIERQTPLLREHLEQINLKLKSKDILSGKSRKNGENI